MMFREAIDDTPELRDAFESGLHALGNDSRKVRLANPRKCHGSVNIEKHLKAICPNENLWDYLFGYDDKAYFVEVHPACTSEVRTVIDKLAWLKNRIRRWSISIQNMPKAYHWIATDKVRILPDSSEARLLAKEGIPRPKRMLKVG